MNAMLVVCMSVSAPVVAIAVYSLQMRLERWDYDRHADD